MECLAGIACRGSAADFGGIRKNRIVESGIEPRCRFFDALKLTESKMDGFAGETKKDGGNAGSIGASHENRNLFGAVFTEKIRQNLNDDHRRTQLYT